MTAPRLKLLVTSPDPELIHHLSLLDPDHVEILHARRPAETIRRFEAESPDLVLVDLSPRPEHEAQLIHALRERPLGPLIPIFLLDRLGLPLDHPLASLDGAREAGVDRFFPHGTPLSAVFAAAAEIMNVPLHIAPPRPQPLPAPAPSAAAAHPWSAQRLPIPPTTASPATPHTSSDALPAWTASHPSLHAPAPPHEVTPEQLRRKLRQARHDDYFTLLDLRKSADHAQIEQAWRTLRQRFDPARLPRALVDRHYQDLAELRDALDDAFGVLGDEDLRKNYLSALLRHEAPSPS